VDDPKARQAAFNAASRDQWDAFAGHRREVSALLGAVAGPGRTRLCVLGAGNGNDLDLPALLAAHREVHLVDLDAEALARGAARQGVAGHPALRLYGGLDVTGMLDAIATWSPRTPIGPADLAALAAWPAGRVGLALPGPFDLVGSTCLLSQLIDTAFRALGGRHPRFGAALRAIRAGHLRLLARLAAPGGAAVLITDVVSSETFPPLSSAPESALAGLLPRLAREGNHIQGVHPADLMSALRDDPELGARVSGLESLRPWRWRLHAREYLVWALKYRIGVGLLGSSRVRRWALEPPGANG
jgi:hypothetical protein